MAKEKDWLYEELGCLECGVLDFTASKVPSLCIDCFNQAKSSSSPS